MNPDPSLNYNYNERYIYAQAISNFHFCAKPHIKNVMYPLDAHYFCDKFRYALMTPILQKLINDILPVSRRVNYTNYVPSDKLPSQVMDECIKGVFRLGWLDVKAVQTLEYLLNLCGSDWFCDRCIEVHVSYTCTCIWDTVESYFIHGGQCP